MSYLALDWVKAGWTRWFLTLEPIVTFLTLALAFITAWIWHRAQTIAVTGYREKRKQKLRWLSLLWILYCLQHYIQVCESHSNFLYPDRGLLGKCGGIHFHSSHTGGRCWDSGTSDTPLFGGHNCRRRSGPRDRNTGRAGTVWEGRTLPGGLHRNRHHIFHNESL